jgi:hypothetical protein
MDNQSLRKFVITVLGDASAYQKTDQGENRTYEKIHSLIAQKVSEVVSDPGNAVSGNTPVVLLAHSLGGHIMSNYIWDRQKAPVTSQSDLENLKTLSGIITFGCNIPLFTFVYTPIVPIEFPPKSLSPELRELAKWLNYYDSDDILSYPLKCINAAYDRIVDEDIAINVGSIFSSWNPASHSEYWTDKDFINPVADYFCKFF